jgi:hypothetical protein
VQRLEENNMKINVSKCFLGNTEVNYLGFILTPTSIKPGKDKLKAVETAKVPQTKEENYPFKGQFFSDSYKGFCQNL